MQKQEKSFLRRFFGSRWFWVAAFIIAILVAIGFARAYYQNYKVNTEIKNLQDQINRLEYKKLESMEILKYVSSDAFIEEKARNELNLKKPGENLLIIKSASESGQMVTTTRPVEKNLLKNYIKWWYYFLHKELPN